MIYINVSLFGQLLHEGKTWYINKCIFVKFLDVITPSMLFVLREYKYFIIQRHVIPIN